MTIFKDNKLLIASNNKGKVAEFRHLLEPFNIQVLSAGEFPYAEPEETGTTFIENAEIKSRYYAERTGLTCLSDDSGIEIDSLNGEPGVYSANWAEKEPGGERDFYMAMQRVEDELKEKGVKTRGELSAEDKKKLKANFICLLSLCSPEGRTTNFTGKVFGTLQFPPKGDKGFGYDPIFVADGHSLTFGEIEKEAKRDVSHRTDAFNKFRDFVAKNS